MRRVFGFIYRYGLLATAHKVFRRGYEPHGMGLCYLLRHGVRRVGAKIDIPTRKGLAINRTLRSSTEVDIVLTHQFGGGAESYLSHKICNAPPSRAIFVVKPTRSTGLYSVELHLHGKKIIWFFVVGLEAFGGLAGWKCRIILNELVQWPTIGRPISNESLFSIVSKLLVLKSKLDAELVFLLHDYYCICPKFTLLDETGAFCWPEVGMSRCNECLKEQARRGYGLSITHWRRTFGQLLSACDEIVAFSEDTKKRVEKCYGNLSIEVIPHELPVKFDPLRTIRPSPMTIGVVGSLRPVKGPFMVKKLAEHLLELKRHDVRIKVVGDVQKGFNMPSNVDVLGQYDVRELPNILEREGVNVAFVPSICAETFSYVTKELIALGLPVACFDIGAQRDHVAAYPRGAVIPEMTSESAWLTILKLYEREFGHVKS